MFRRMSNDYDYMFEESYDEHRARYSAKSLCISFLILAILGIIIYFLVHKM